MIRSAWIVPLVVAIVGCDKAPAGGAAAHGGGTAPGDAASASSGTSAPAEPPAAAASVELADDPALHRSYGPADLKFHACVKVSDDGVVHGEQCPSAFVVFGPYVPAPARTNLRVAFDIEAGGKLFVMSDVVSDVGKQFHGLLEEQALAAGESRKLGYKIHLFQPASAVEARIGIRADGLVNFKITNLPVTVE